MKNSQLYAATVTINSITSSLDKDLAFKKILQVIDFNPITNCRIKKKKSLLC